MNTMKAIQVAAKGEPMKLVTIPIPQPKEGQVLLRVEACGICHGDFKVIEGAASSYPRIPGHEVVGIVDKLGEGVTKWKIGQRVGIGCTEDMDIQQHLLQMAVMQNTWLPMKTDLSLFRMKSHQKKQLLCSVQVKPHSVHCITVVQKWEI
ncbi:MAG: alcohol dehydrogenase catalytic domain-containing protein [Ruminococcus sp.]|nr:alcohol dehydrogenase catalytic domain-containing protein [Ruminococcus sp.]